MCDPVVVGEAMTAVLAGADGVVPDYAVAVDAATLTPPSRLAGEVRLLVAATVGGVRLIDNVGVVLAPPGAEATVTGAGAAVAGAAP